MFETSTVLILGAGTSVPYGYPSGRGLVDDLKGDNPKRKEILIQLQFQKPEIDEFTAVLRKAEPPSIDHFLENNPRFTDLGKACIAYEILKRENENRLYHPKVDKEGSIRSWYRDLADRIADSADEIAFNNLSIVTFNYDRSLEHFL